MIITTIYYIVTGVAVALLIVAAVKRERIQIYEDGIKIKDSLYPLTIPNDTIVSISLVDSLPKLIRRTNGTGIGLILKGYFTVKNSSLEYSENATLYIRNRNASAIEIRTVKGLVYINQKNDELTQSLFNEMKNTVKILENNELNLDAKRPRTYRSVIVIAVFFVVLLTPTLFMNYSNEVVVGNDVIEIKGEYAMAIPVSEIDTVLLIEELPSIRTRADGISTRKVNIGKFKMIGGDKANLYINKNVDMFIEIKLNAHNSQSKADLIFINRKTVEETKALYEEIFNSKY
ncbi:MAG: hypothetical protein J6U85_07540 [Bacteroidales bacterium]|nr:hypothetical protein [Bacteroidales bacterium]